MWANDRLLRSRATRFSLKQCSSPCAGYRSIELLLCIAIATLVGCQVTPMDDGATYAVPRSHPVVNSVDPKTSSTVRVNERLAASSRRDAQLDAGTGVDSDGCVLGKLSTLQQ